MSGSAQPGGVLIVGAGAVGCALAGTLRQVGVKVTLVARGAALAALRAKGLILETEAGQLRLDVDTAETIPANPADILILALKSQQLPALASGLAGRQELVIPVVNGIPFWFAPDGAPPFNVDPGGALARLVPPSRLAGCAAYLMARMAAPGHVVCLGAPLLHLGALVPSGVPAVASAAATLRAGGVRVEVDEQPAEAMWRKLLANAATNPLSVLTAATLRQIGLHEALRGCAEAVAEEMTALGRAAGLALAGEPAGCLQAIASAGEHVTSMRQDYEAGRPLEYDAICGAPLALAAHLGVAMPVSQTIFALTRYAAASRPDAGA